MVHRREAGQRARCLWFGEHRPIRRSVSRAAAGGFARMAERLSRDSCGAGRMGHRVRCSGAGRTGSGASQNDAEKCWDCWPANACPGRSAFYFLTFGGFVAFSIYLPSLLKDQFHLAPADAGFRTAGFVILATLLRPLGGWLADRIGAARVLSAVFSMVIPFALLLAWRS